MGEWLSIGDTGHQAYLARPAGGAGPGVLVLHAWWGLTPVFTHVCDDLATRGYVALAPSLFAGGATAETISAAGTTRIPACLQAPSKALLLASGTTAVAPAESNSGT